MLRLSVTVEGADAAAAPFTRARERLARPPRPVLEEIASTWANEVFPRVFERGGDPPWEPLSAVSVKLRGPSRPLEGEGILRQSIQVLDVGSTEARVGTELGAVHQVGGRTSPASMIPDKEIPARPFLALDDAAVSASFRRIFDFYFGEVL